MPPGAKKADKRTARRLGADDLEGVVAIDRAHTGHARRHFFEKRMAAARQHPDDFIQVGVTAGGALQGFAIARLLRGEFGHAQAVAVLDAIGVAPQSQERGVGQALVDELVSSMRAMGVRSLHSQADWSDQHLLGFLQAAGFAIAPRLALERSVAEPLNEASEEI
jgi:ribosomal protein S18 acetylase RimI-like enzyme